jgi:hypothetical protein
VGARPAEGGAAAVGDGAGPALPASWLTSSCARRASRASSELRRCARGRGRRRSALRGRPRRSRGWPLVARVGERRALKPWPGFSCGVTCSLALPRNRRPLYLGRPVGDEGGSGSTRDHRALRAVAEWVSADQMVFGPDALVPRHDPAAAGGGRSPSAAGTMR